MHVPNPGAAPCFGQETYEELTIVDLPKRLIFVAAGAAQKAADFVLGTAHVAPSPEAEALAA